MGQFSVEKSCCLGQLSVEINTRRLYNPNHRLPAGMDVDVDVLHRNLLLALPTMAVERLNESRIGPR